MNIFDVCSKAVYCVTKDQPLADAARRMQELQVGAIVVTASQGSQEKPIGIVTDRDIVCGQLAREADMFCLTVADVMTSDPLTLPEDGGLAEGIAALKARGVRRAPVVNADGKAVGMVTMDDLLPAVAQELAGLSTLVGTQSRLERIVSR